MGLFIQLFKGIAQQRQRLETWLGPLDIELLLMSNPLEDFLNFILSAPLVSYHDRETDYKIYSTIS